MFRIAFFFQSKMKFGNRYSLPENFSSPQGYFFCVSREFDRLEKNSQKFLVDTSKNHLQYFSGNLKQFQNFRIFILKNSDPEFLVQPVTLLTSTFSALLQVYCRPKGSSLMSRTFATRIDYNGTQNLQTTANTGLSIKGKGR